MLRCEVDEEKKLFVLSFVIGLRANFKREVKAHPLYSLNVAYQKGLDYEKYLRVVLRRVPFNLDIHPSRPRTFPRSHLVPNLSTLHHHYDLLFSSTRLAKITIPVSSSTRPFTSQIDCYHCHATSHIICHCPQHALVIGCVEDNLLENTDELLVMDPS